MLHLPYMILLGSYTEKLGVETLFIRMICITLTDLQLDSHHYADEGIHGMNSGFTKYLIGRFWMRITMVCYFYEKFDSILLTGLWQSQ